MKNKFTLAHLLTPILALLLISSAQAAMTLDPSQSTLSFVSIKKGAVAEVHHFSSISGSFSDEGQLAISIELDSVQTNVDIRNVRMRETLFETSKFPAAEITAVVTDTIPENTITPLAVEADLTLHGMTQAITIHALATRSGDQLLVTSTQPVIVNAGDFSLTAGIEALKEIAKLPSIALAVPVSFTLVFK